MTDQHVPDQDVKEEPLPEARPVAEEAQDKQQDVKPEPTAPRKNRSAADFLMQTNGGPQREDSQEEKKEKQQKWQRFVEPPQRRHQYHDFPSYFFAGFWIRGFAYIVDLMCIGFVSSIVLDRLLGAIGLAAGGNRTPYGLLTLGMYLAYFILMTKFTNGQTIGKMIFGIQVVCFKEETLSWGTVLVREGACRFILKSGFFMLGYLPAAFTANKQHLGDLFSDTSVVTLNSIKAYQGAKF